MPATVGVESSNAAVHRSSVGTLRDLRRDWCGRDGEVYRARDSRLGRDVALKVLPEAFARDADRMLRFLLER